MKCKEAENLWMEDGATRIFLNTRGKKSRRGEHSVGRAAAVF